MGPAQQRAGPLHLGVPPGCACLAGRERGRPGTSRTPLLLRDGSWPSVPAAARQWSRGRAIRPSSRTGARRWGSASKAKRLPGNAEPAPDTIGPARATQTRLETLHAGQPHRVLPVDVRALRADRQPDRQPGSRKRKAAWRRPVQVVAVV